MKPGMRCMSLSILVLKMFPSNTKNCNYNLRHKQKTLLEKKGTNTVFTEHCNRHLLPKVVKDKSETILQKITTHSYHGFHTCEEPQLLNTPLFLQINTVLHVVTHICGVKK